MTPNIDTLPAEIIEAIISRLDDGDVMKLSTICKALRARTAHRVFHTIRFSNDPRIADAALAAVRNYGIHVRVLRFVGYAGEEDGDLDVEPALKPVNRDILPPSALVLFEASTTLLPSLEQFSISFDHDYDYSREFDGPYSACMFEQPESWDMVHAREAKLTMCRLWANTYKALAGNKTTPGLVIENWSPRGVSTFQTAEWRAYLGRLKTLDIRITAARQAWSFTNSMAGYVKDIAKMQGLFFEHLKTLQTLKISTWPEIPFGMHGTHHIPLPLRATGRMPALQHLTLSNLFISADLATLILRCKTHLRTVILHNAQSAAADYGESASQPLPWSAFFDALSAGLGEDDGDEDEVSTLTQLTVTSTAPLSETEAKSGRINYHTERAAVKQVRAELRGGSGRRLFGYGDLHEYHGYFVHDVKTNQRSAVEGVDQAAWDRLAAKLDAKRGYVVVSRAVGTGGRSEVPVAELKKTMKGRGAGSGKKGAGALGVVGGGEDGAGAAKAGPAEAGTTVDIPIRTARPRKMQTDNAQGVQPRRSSRIARMRGQDSV